VLQQRRAFEHRGVDDLAAPVRVAHWMADSPNASSNRSLVANQVVRRQDAHHTRKRGADARIASVVSAAGNGPVCPTRHASIDGWVARQVHFGTGRGLMTPGRKPRSRVGIAHQVSTSLGARLRDQRRPGDCD
jgi:hypothetical protein